MPARLLKAGLTFAATIFVIAIMGATVMMASGTGPVAKSRKLIERGVSYELAQMREALVKDLRYELDFNIPASPDDSVTGEAVLRFNLAKRIDLPIDFRKADLGSCGIEVNGRQVEARTVDEHIIIPRKALKAGENSVRIAFTPETKPLNRRDDYLYTLLVPDRARTLFPCMDQPGMKARYSLSLDVPQEWTAVSNTFIADSCALGEGRKKLIFAETEPLSTYLFSFVAGQFKRAEYVGNHRIGAYYRETDPDRVAQLETIFRQVDYSLDWLEDFTGLDYPFAKYDFVVMPGFQFGGMEHTGATLYNDNTLFLNAHPTVGEELSRAKLVAHETAHMWFGDLVTMRWFNDVWTKEVFANYFAARICESMTSDGRLSSVPVDNEVVWLDEYVDAAMAQDRTNGRTSIRQDLPNMQYAGLVYNNIIYDKAPVMMRKIVEIMGEDAFRRAIGNYVKTYAYGNADWNDLVAILDAETDADLRTFSSAWVDSAGLPHFSWSVENGALVIRQDDPSGQGLVWPQSFAMTVRMPSRDTVLNIVLDGTASELKYKLPLTKADYKDIHVIPNTDGLGYGIFLPSEVELEWLLANWQSEKEAVTRYALLMNLRENYLVGHISDRAWADMLLRELANGHDAMTQSALAGYLRTPLRFLEGDDADAIETDLMNLTFGTEDQTLHQALLRCMMSAKTDAVWDRLEAIWRDRSEPLLSENDYNSLAWQLAVRRPEKGGEVIAAQRARISNPDRLSQFDFISRAAVADTEALDSLFASLLLAENRTSEPWTLSALSLLCHPLRAGHAVRYIRPGLEQLETIRQNSDIFFPGNWCSSLLGSFSSPEALEELESFLSDNPDMLHLLRRKIDQASFMLEMRNGTVLGKNE